MRIIEWIKNNLLWQVYITLVSTPNAFSKGETHLCFWIGFWRQWAPTVGWEVYRVRDGVGLVIHKFRIMYGEERYERKKINTVVIGHS